MYGASIFVCLPDGLSSQPSVGTGTVMRVSNSTAVNNGTGFSQGSSAVFESRGNNTVRGNTTNISGTITAIGGS